jgi:hypothetical protein
MCTGGRREVNRLSMGGRRVTADRRYENGESGDYSQDIFNLHRLPSFLVLERDGDHTSKDDGGLFPPCYALQMDSGSPSVRVDE